MQNLLTLTILAEADRQRLARLVMDAVEAFGGNVFSTATTIEDLMRRVRDDCAAAGVPVEVSLVLDGRRLCLVWGERRETLARITYQRLFRRYVRLSGMSGTGREVAREVQAIYRLPVTRVPLHRPLRRVSRGVRILPTLQEKWNAVAETVAGLTQEEQRPVLIGTRSVSASENLSAVLSERGIEHALLNAKQDRLESNVVAQAGKSTRVTVATNMAGRGTDIRLGEGVAARGGLHVILTEYHESRRIDRQLFGRCGRQGDPGGCEAIVSLEDELFIIHAAGLIPFARGLVGSQGMAPAWVVWLLRTVAQAAAERRNRSVRIQNVKLDRQLAKMLAFSGGGE